MNELHSTNALNNGRTTSLYRISVLVLILLNAVMNYIDTGGACEVGDQNDQAVWEVVLRVDGSDVAIASAFMAAGNNIDVILGAQEPLMARQYADIIKYAAHLIGSAKYSEDWSALHAGGSGGNETRALPF